MVKNNKKELSWTATLWISLFLGWLGVDRFMMGKIGTGLLKLFTLGGFGVWWLIDIILLLSSYNFKNIKWIFPKNKIVHIVLVLILLFTGVLGNALSENTSNSSSSSTSVINPPQIKENTKDYVIEDLEDITFNMFSPYSDLTDLQKEAYWNKWYENKYIKGKLIVHNVDTNMFGTYVVLAGQQPKGQYEIGSDYAIFFKDSEADKLIALSKGDIIYFDGKLDDYHEINKNLDIIDSIVLTENEFKLPSKNVQAELEAKENLDYLKCEDITDYKKELTCIGSIAIELQDLEKCKSLPAQLDDKFSVRGWCIIGIAQATNNSALCDEIIVETRKEECLRYFN